MGHKESDCWRKHPEKGPDWYKDKTERDPSGAAVEIMEILVMAVEGDIVEKETCRLLILILPRKKLIH